MKTEATAERVRSLLNYDPATGQFTWNVSNSNRAPVGSIAGGVRGDGYWRIRVDGHLYAAHRLAWLYVHGSWPNEDIDHIDGDRLNNRISNLREATRSQNLANMRPSSKSKSGLKGAAWNARKQRWMARIKVEGCEHFLGYFKTPEEAHAAYAEAAIRLRGTFARVA